MHKILERQIKKIFGSTDSIPKSLEAFLKLVDDAYKNADEDRLLIERSLEISSKELLEANSKMREEAGVLKGNIGELEKMNQLMIDRELKMIELKKEIAILKKTNIA